MPNNRIRDFYNYASYAIYGMSKSKRNFAWSIYDSLRSIGKTVYPVHTKRGKAFNVDFYDSADSILDSTEAAVICLNLKKRPEVVEDLKTKGFKAVWLQNKCYDSLVKGKIEKAGIACETGCVLMYQPETAFPHRLHRFFHDLFSKDKN